MQACVYETSWSEDSRIAASRNGPAWIESKRPELDLRQWIDLPTLAEWIQGEIEPFIPLSMGLALAAPNAVDRFRKMLTILCFGYSSGLTRSAEIAEASRREPEFQSIAGGFHPFADELRNFRRRYRALLEVVLTRLFMRAAVLNPEFAREAAPRELKSQFETRARDLLNVARHYDSCED